MNSGSGVTIVKNIQKGGKFRGCFGELLATHGKGMHFVRFYKNDIPIEDRLVRSDTISIFPHVYNSLEEGITVIQYIHDHPELESRIEV